jgi:pimeloyl-ACP methyl ester carboxylesterase
VLSGPTVDPAAATATRQFLLGLRDLLHEDPFQLPILLRDVRDAGAARVWSTLRHALRDPITTKLPLVTVPTLVLRGELEPIVTPAWGRQVADLIPGGRLATIPASPHNCVYGPFVPPVGS